MTEYRVEKGVLKFPYKVKEDSAGLQDRVSDSLSLLGYEGEVPILTLISNGSREMVNTTECVSDNSKKELKSWRGKKLILKSEDLTNNKLVIVGYKNKKMIEALSKSNASSGSSDEGKSYTIEPINPVDHPLPIAKPVGKANNFRVYNIQTDGINQSCPPLASISNCGSVVSADHNYFTARRKSTDVINVPMEPGVSKNRSTSVDKLPVEYKLFNKNQQEKQESVKYLKLFKQPSYSPPPLEILKCAPSKINHKKKSLPARVETLEMMPTTRSIGINTDEDIFKKFIESKIEEREPDLDVDTELIRCLEKYNLFDDNCDISGSVFNIQPMDSLHNGNLLPGNQNSAAINWKKQFFLDLKKCDSVDVSGNRPLHLAVMQNNEKFVQRQCISLRARDIDINFTNSENLNALQLALMHNADVGIVEVLLRYNCDTMVIDSEGNNIFHLAVLYSNESVIRLLVTTPDLCDVNGCNFEGYTPLILCIINQKHKMADLLLYFGADPNIGDKKSGRTALFHAIEFNDADMVKLLINGKALTKVKNYFGTSPHDAMFELDSIDASIRKLVLNRDDVSSAKPKIARGKRKRITKEGDSPKVPKTFL